MVIKTRITFLAVLTLLFSSIATLASPPELSNLDIINTSCKSDSCEVTIQLRISHQVQGDNPIAQVSSLKIYVFKLHHYENKSASQPQPIATSTDHPIKANKGDSLEDYETTISGIPNTCGCVVIEASAKHGNDYGYATWEGSLTTGSGNYHSSIPADMKLPVETENAKSDALYESDTKNITVNACGSDMKLEFDGGNAEIYHEKKPDKKLNSKWTFWEESDLSIDLIGNLPNSPPEYEHSNKWIPSENFSKKTIQIPKGWSGEIKYKVLVKRKGLKDIAGDYSGSIDISIDGVDSDG